MRLLKHAGTYSLVDISMVELAKLQLGLVVTGEPVLEVSAPVPAAAGPAVDAYNQGRRTCACGYPAISHRDLDEHIAAMMNVFDGSRHA